MNLNKIEWKRKKRTVIENKQNLRNIFDNRKNIFKRRFNF